MHELATKAPERDSFHKKFDIECNCRQFCYSLKSVDSGNVVFESCPPAFLLLFTKKKLFIQGLPLTSMTYAVYTTESFDKEVEKLPGGNQDIIQKMFFKIRDNPYTSDQLRYRNLREKRIKEKRVYFLVYDDLQAVLIVALGGKKDQHTTINHIVKYFDEYREYLEKLIRGG